MCGLSTSVMLMIAKISSRVSPLSLLTLSNDNASNVSPRAGDCVTLLVRSSFDTLVVVVLVICVVAIETVVSALNVALHHIAVLPSVMACLCHECHSCGLRFANDSSSHSSCGWIYLQEIFPSVHVGFQSMANCSFFEC